ncbi:adenosylcobinamide-phosphate synthase CbiB [Agrobacterium sp. ES01]|uniref:adenosylcobinamide-phosphate synthase CbiB n=1 Tax=Agrobacterium sp. ES01 TaxID=3420714 RepID=UPI003D15285B
MIRLAILLIALVLDRIIGDPPKLWSRIPHPVVLFGAAIAFLDHRLNKPLSAPSLRKRNGVIAIAALLVLALTIGWLLHAVFWQLGIAGFALEAVLVSVLLAHKSLRDHVDAVAKGLRQGGLEGGRKAVSMIVGRDPNTLDEAGVSRAAIESLAENFADGVVAPALWYALLGLPGLVAYKMLNTADSMIGHKNETYLHFGWASARLDDVANWPAARLSAGAIAAAATLRWGLATGARALTVAARDSGLHRSPNSGWPEAAFAGALDIRLAGPRIYGGVLVSEPMINGAGQSVVGEADINRAVGLFDICGWVLCAVTAIGIVLLAML